VPVSFAVMGGAADKQLESPSTAASVIVIVFILSSFALGGNAVKNSPD
jgi:hypothetical protein